MSPKELSRAQVLRQLDEGHLRQQQAAERLDLSVRQVQRLLFRYRQDGVPALVSRQRGQPSNHQLDPATKAQALELLKTRYYDFGPTLAHEKLTEIHQLPLGRETVRQLMIAADLRHPHQARRPVVHPLRERRARLGELVQMDGSPYAWFEDRAAECTLLAYIDDATTRVMILWFTPAESTASYFEATERYLCQYGKPLAFYSDKLSVFRINRPDDLSERGQTQFGRALQELDITLICANTPQAKGRVERLNGIFQDRLVKELRLQGISSIADGNAYAPEFIADYNRRFAVSPRDPRDAHRPLLVQDDLKRILTVQERRTLSKNLTLQYNRVVYQIQTKRPSYALRHAHVLVREDVAGKVTIEYKGKVLPYTLHHQQSRQAEEVSSKQLPLKLDAVTRTAKPRQPHIPPPEHPWRRFRISRKKDNHQSAHDISTRQK